MSFSDKWRLLQNTITSQKARLLSPVPMHAFRTQFPSLERDAKRLEEQQFCVRLCLLQILEAALIKLTNMTTQTWTEQGQCQKKFLSGWGKIHETSTLHNELLGVKQYWVGEDEHTNWLLNTKWSDMETYTKVILYKLRKLYLCA